MFSPTGVSAFPITPIRDDVLDLDAFAHVIDNLAHYELGSVGVLGSTGSYPYLDAEERTAVIRTAVQHSGGLPVIAGVGSLRQRDVLRNVQAASAAGAQAVLLAPVTYQPLREQEVLSLFKAVSDASSVPVIVYDNPGTTRFNFSFALYEQLGHLPNICSIKIPPLGAKGIDPAVEYANIRSSLPAEVAVGISGDPVAMNAIRLGCSTWYSVIAGVFPQRAIDMFNAAAAHNVELMDHFQQLMKPSWDLFTELGGSYRFIGAAAQVAGLVDAFPHPLPIQPLLPREMAVVEKALTHAQLL